MNPHDLKDFATGSGLSHRFGLLTNRKLLCLKCVNGALFDDNILCFLSVTFYQNVTAPLMRGMVCRDACRYLQFWGKSLKQSITDITEGHFSFSLGSIMYYIAVPTKSIIQLVRNSSFSC